MRDPLPGERVTSDNTIRVYLPVDPWDENTPFLGLVEIPEDLREAVAACAEAMGLSFNGAVQAALIDFVSHKERHQQVAEFFEEGRDRFDELLGQLSVTLAARPRQLPEEEP